MRLDLYLLYANLTYSRTRASNLIKLNKIQVNGKIINKPSYTVKVGDSVKVVSDYPLTLGGIKLSHALSEFSVSVDSKVCLDIGASNGGFTDVLLKNNAQLVYALDVGECALPDYLINHDKVV